MSVVTNIQRPDKILIDGFRTLGTATILESMDAGGTTCGNMTSLIRPVYFGAKIAGPAVTAFCHVGDNLTIHKALQVAKEGDVLVVNGRGYTEAGYWGELMSLAAKEKGVEGLVIDGGVRDIAETQEIGFPVFALGVSPGRTVKETFGTVNKPIYCGGVYAEPGDIVVGDDTGVVVVPKKMAKEVLEKARDRQKKEAEIIRQIQQGKFTDFMEISGYERKLRKIGVKTTR